MDRGLFFAAVVSCLGASCTTTSQEEAPLDDETELTRCRDDGNPCTSDVRAHGRCTHVPLADGTACPGGACSAGVCRATQPPADAGTPDASTREAGASDATTSDAGTALDAGPVATAASCAQVDVQ